MSEGDRVLRPLEGATRVSRPRTGAQFSEEKAFLALAENATRVGYWSWDFVSDAFWYSAEFYRLHGLNPGAFGDRIDDYLAFIHPEDRERVKENAWAATAGDLVPTEYRFVHPEGGIRHLLGQAALVSDPIGKAQRLVGTVQDASAILSAKRSVSDAFARLSAFFEEIHTPAYLWRREGDDLVLRRFNKAARARWGERADELTGALASELCADRPDIVADVKECMRTQAAITRETDYQSERGTSRLVITYIPVARDAVVAHVEDVSELLAVRRREDEAANQLAQYFERVPTPAFLWRQRDSEIVLEGANHAAVESTHGRVNQIIGVTATRWYAQRPDIIEDLRRSFGGETFTREMQYETHFTEGVQDLVVTYVHIPPDLVAVHTRDVTEQKITEAALRESHEAARGILDACTQPIVLFEPDGTVLALNEAVGATLGVSKEELIGRRIYDFLAPESVDGRRAAVERVIQSGQPGILEGVEHGRNLRARLYPILDEAGEPSRVVAYAEDVTEEREAHAALLQSRERLEEAQRIGHLGHWHWDGVGGELSWSREVYRIYGMDPSEEVTYERFLQGVHPEDRENVEAAANRARSTEGRYSCEHRVVRPDGTIRVVLARGEVRNESDGGAPTIAGTVLDITELKKAEQSVRDREAELSTIIERNPDGICLTVDGCIRICNRSMGALLGSTKESIEGRRLKDLIVPEERKIADEKCAALLKGGASEPGEFTLQRSDGSTVAVEIYGAAFEFRGEPALICTLRDIEMRKEAEQELAESRDMLRALTQHLESVREEERVQVARDLHDELGSVLTALKIDLFEAMSGDESVDPEVFEAMSGRLDQAIEVGRRVISRLRPGILDDLGLAAAVEWLGADLEKRTGIRCKVVLPHDEPELAEPVATAMFRIFQEALTNVIRHADAGAVEVILGGDDQRVSLKVEDDGKGFDTASSLAGGFGLLGMRERVRAFKGEFEVFSAPGGGTKIEVTLPLRPIR